MQRVCFGVSREFGCSNRSGILSLFGWYVTRGLWSQTRVEFRKKRRPSEGPFSCSEPGRSVLKRFVQGLTVSRPAAWSTEILHVDQVDANRVALDVGLKVKTEGKDQTPEIQHAVEREALVLHLPG